MLATVDSSHTAPPGAACIPGPHASSTAWPGWPVLIADVLIAPRTAFRPLAGHPAIWTPLACLAATKFAGLFAHFAPSLSPGRAVLGIALQGVLALVTAAAWAAAVYGLLAVLATAPPLRPVVTLFLVAALWPEAAWVVSEGIVAAAGAYPDAFDPRVDRVTSLVWFARGDAAPAVRALANAVDGPTLYRDALLAVGLPQVAPGVTRRAALAVAVTLRLVLVAVAIFTR